jgi:trimethylguanosine synthase
MSNRNDKNSSYNHQKRQSCNPGTGNRGTPAESWNKNWSPHRRDVYSPKKSHPLTDEKSHHDVSISPSISSRISAQMSPKKEKITAAMSVICNRVILFDCAPKSHHFEESDDEGLQICVNSTNVDVPVAAYHFNSNSTSQTLPPASAVAVIRVPKYTVPSTSSQRLLPNFDVIDNSIPNPISNLVHDKYWAQRRRLFWKFDMGIQLDPEGWYSVTPEVIAHHVAKRVANLAMGSQSFILLDAFCGCGGNAIAFAQEEQLSLIVCADIDRTKLRKAAYNACLYEIPSEKLIFVECSSLFLLEHCYHDGKLCLENLKNASNLPYIETEMCAGFFIGGLGMLPHRIDAVFMDPPWGGVDYNSLGKNGYCLEKHMKIKLGPHHNPHTDRKTDIPPTPPNNTITDDFFDTFGVSNSTNSTRHAKENFNIKEDESDYWTGSDLLKVAACATNRHLVIYDMPRNTSKTSLGRCALAAGYHGNIKLEEHYLNGRLKTITAYLGADFRPLLNSCHNENGEINTAL